MTNAEYLTLEHEVQAQGYAVVCGADEAGAGPLAGPVYAAAVSLPDDFDLPWLNDSKKVTPKRREVLFDQIKEQAVAWAVENGITKGTSETTFHPDETCTRAQGVTFLYRALGKLAAAQAGFTDVAADSYYADAVNWAAENGVTNGISETLFGPDGSCTRAQIVTFLYRAYQGK